MFITVPLPSKCLSYCLERKMKTINQHEQVPNCWREKWHQRFQKGTLPRVGEGFRAVTAGSGQAQSRREDIPGEGTTSTQRDVGGKPAVRGMCLLGAACWRAATTAPELGMEQRPAWVACAQQALRTTALTSHWVNTHWRKTSAQEDYKIPGAKQTTRGGEKKKVSATA